MNYIVVDLEWNQPLSRAKLVKTPIRLNGEIIQIGAAKLNEQMEMIDTFNIMISPVFYQQMNKRVIEITEIHNSDLEEGVSFIEAFEKFAQWCGDNFIFLTWGPEDIFMLEDNMLIHNLDIDWIPEYYDAQLIFDDQITMQNRQFALNYAMYKLDIKPLRCHDALNDAVNTAEVIRKLDLVRGIEEYYGDDDEDNNEDLT